MHGTAFGRLGQVGSAAILATSGLWMQSAQAAPIVTTVVNETFPTRDTTLVYTVNSADTTFMTQVAGMNISVPNSDAFGAAYGTGNALRIRPYGTERPVLGTFAGASLGTGTGDQVLLNFDFYVAGTSASDKTTINSNGTFRFGLYNSNGTAATASTASVNGTGGGDDYGYQLQVGLGTVSELSLYKETGGNGQILSGSDQTSLAAAASGVAITSGGSTLYKAALTLTRNSAGGVDLAAEIKDAAGASLGTISVANLNSGFYSSFNELAFGTTFSGGAGSVSIDNITVQTSAVPEPAAMGLVGAAGLLLARRRRER